MVKFLSVTLALVSAFNVGAASAACSLNMVTNNAKLLEFVQAHSVWPVTDAQCDFLQKRNLDLNLTGSTLIHNGTSVAWASVRLSRGNQLVSNRNADVTVVDSTMGSTSKAEELLVTAITQAVTHLDFEVAARELENARMVQKAKGK